MTKKEFKKALKKVDPEAWERFKRQIKEEEGDIWREFLNRRLLDNYLTWQVLSDCIYYKYSPEGYDYWIGIQKKLM